MAKLCARGKAAAKRKLRFTPLPMPNMYASGVCSGKITPVARDRKAKGGLCTKGMGRAYGKNS